jgi:hypothetical protein
VNQAPPVDVIEDDEDGVKSESESLVDSFYLTFLLAIFGAIVILLTYGIRKMKKV